ncbi:uncharacterized protein EI90DRAFT_3288152 [Cantharellus anzutake]|uniref:uncharacterized protein n=1 Tax=Cantharellus anzutake TaxID=1750568 RepID=UPI0019081E29|nr:uncharacterized protein EI90DRAFT_3288152 [Cantharellus anzutake]KAF8334662.1 hypothetical protein EI90DRAFT_3288152 [Cantharellus anzutake]
MPALKLAYLAHDLSDGLLSHDLVDVIDSWVGIASAACSVHPVYVPRIGREQWRSNSATQQSMEYIGFDSKPHFASHCVMATKVNDQDHIPDKFKTADFSANGCNVKLRREKYIFHGHFQQTNCRGPKTTDAFKDQCQNITMLPKLGECQIIHPRVEPVGMLLGNGVFLPCFKQACFNTMGEKCIFPELPKTSPGIGYKAKYEHVGTMSDESSATTAVFPGKQLAPRGSKGSFNTTLVWDAVLSVLPSIIALGDTHIHMLDLKGRRRLSLQRTPSS